MNVMKYCVIEKYLPMKHKLFPYQDVTIYDQQDPKKQPLSLQ